MAAAGMERSELRTEKHKDVRASLQPLNAVRRRATLVSGLLSANADRQLTL